jgi:tetratricopeptide (TPR) repeat protein
VLGGIANPAEVDPTTWGIFLLAVELWLWHRSVAGGRPRSLYAMVPLFLIWANVDESFLIGLLVLAAQVVGLAIGARRPDAARPKPTVGLVVLALSAVVVLANPSFWRIYPAAALPFLRLIPRATDILTQDQISFFGPESWKYLNRSHGGEDSGAYLHYLAYYVVIVGAGLGSFVLNRKRLQYDRLLVFALISVLWGARMVWAPEFAVIWAACMALNGQEWYQDRFGTRGRVEAGWRWWSVGGRALTLLALFFLLFKGLTGYSASVTEPVFGFGYNSDDFAFEAADFVADSKLTGNILNLNLSSGDALIWRAWPRNPLRRSFVDSRKHLFSARFRVELQDLIRALADGRRADWQPKLDEHNITVVMVPIGLAPNLSRTYQGLKDSPDWIPFYDDGNVVLFGRADAPAEDREVFLGRRLDATNLAYHVERMVPSLDRPPTPTSALDQVFRNRIRRGMQPHVAAAGRWLAQDISESNPTPDLAHCLVTIGEIRTALAQNPDDPAAWQLLCEAYSKLIQAEMAVFDQAKSAIPEAYLNFRMRQRAAALNFAIQATPPPRSDDARAFLAQLHGYLADLYQGRGYYDLARDQLAKVKELLPADLWKPELQARLDQLDEGVKRVEAALDQLTEERQAGPLQLVDPALREGCLGLAIAKLDEAEASGVGQGALKARLLDLYCQAGWPDRALELFDASSVEDPALNTGPGTAPYREGLVYFLIGSYNVADTFWRTRAIREVQNALVYESLEAVRSALRGSIREAADAEQTFPSLVASQAEWEAELGLGLLEAGNPRPAGEHMQTALKLKPDLSLRPLLAHYLERLGLPVPPPRKAKPATGELPEDVFQAEPK